MQDDDPESDEHDSPELHDVLAALAAAPRPRVTNHAHVQLPDPLLETFANEPERELRTPREGELVDGRYRIEGILGSGGMGVVFSATHVATGRRVALKWLRFSSNHGSETERQAALKRFVREARAAGRIRHPNVVDVHDAGTEPHTPFLVMELLDGETLRARMERGPLSWEEALAILLPAMEGVEEAHRRGVVHRDLKPDNVFLARDASGAVCPKVLDFGISRLHNLEAGEQAAVSVTRTGTVLGTPAYMPLEQLRAKGDVDGRADVYALGVVLYEMLTQKRPYVARNAADFAALMASERATPLTRFRPDLRGFRERAVMRALERAPADRYASVGEFAAALKAGEPTLWKPYLGWAVAMAVVSVAAWSVLAPESTQQALTTTRASANDVRQAPESVASPTPDPSTAIDRPPEPAVYPAATLTSPPPPRAPAIRANPLMPPSTPERKTRTAAVHPSMPEPAQRPPAKPATHLTADDFVGPDSPLSTPSVPVRPSAAPSDSPAIPSLGLDQF